MAPISLKLGAAAEGAEAVVEHGKLSALAPRKFEAAGRWYDVYVRRRQHNLSLSVSEDKVQTEVVKDSLQEGHHEVKHQDLDAAEWKSQDHYALLGLGKLRWKATPEDIKTAYKRQVLKHHPDKKSTSSTTDEERAQADSFFTCIKKAHEVLSNPGKRVLYDSVDTFDESVPGTTTNPKAFFTNFGPAFERNSRWLKKQPVPLLGDNDAGEDAVNAFYDFWYNTDSWREFGYNDEEDPDNADSREEKRWIERQNKAARKKKKKEDSARMMKLIDNAFASDPRLKRFKEERKRQKEEKKKAKNRERIEAELAAEAKRKADEEAAAAAAAAARVQKKSSAEATKKARRAFTKAWKRQGLLVEGQLISGMPFTQVQLEERRSQMDASELQPITKLQGAEFIAAVRALFEGPAAAAEAVEEGPRPWTAEEQKTLEQAMTSVPADAEERWQKIADQVPDRSLKECVLRAKECAALAKAAAAAGPVMPAEWTDEEERVVVKAASKVFPPGTQGDRWAQIGEYVKTHAHTAWTRPNKSIIAKVNELKDINVAREKHISAATDFEEFEKTQKKRDRSVPSESKPTTAFD